MSILLAISIPLGIHSHYKGGTEEFVQAIYSIGPPENSFYTKVKTGEIGTKYLFEFLGACTTAFAGLGIIISDIKKRNNDINDLQELVRIYAKDALNWSFTESDARRFMEGKWDIYYGKKT